MSNNINETLAAVHGTMPLSFRVFREVYNVQSLELMPANQSPFFLEDARGLPLPLHLPIDPIVGMTALRYGKWDPRKQEFLALMLRGVAEDVTLIDVGSNVGLFSRQCLNAIPRIRKVHCYEPNALNFRLLERNLGSLAHIELNNFGLSNTDGSMDFFLDPDNAGNHSLNPNAIVGESQTIKIEVRSAQAESRRWMAESAAPFVYKSDTQGFDEVISTSIDDAFWPRVKGGIFELWRLPGKDFDEQGFVRILDRFPNKVFEKKPSENVSSAAVVEYLASDDMEYDDLFFWR